MTEQKKHKSQKQTKTMLKRSRQIIRKIEAVYTACKSSYRGRNQCFSRIFKQKRHSKAEYDDPDQISLFDLLAS